MGSDTMKSTDNRNKK